MITRDNILKICNKAKKNNNISLLSTKCLANKNYKGSNYRIFGSAAYSFYKFIVGEVNEYIYCDGAKIWDCFTGLRLSSLINCKIQVKQKKWINKPTFKTEAECRYTLTNKESVESYTMKLVEAYKGTLPGPIRGVNCIPQKLFEELKEIKDEGDRGITI